MNHNQKLAYSIAVNVISQGIKGAGGAILSKAGLPNDTLMEGLLYG